MKKTLKMIACSMIFLALTGCGNNPTPSDNDKNVVTFNDKELNITVDNLYDELKTRYAMNYLINEIDETILNKEYKDTDEAADYVDNQIKIFKLYNGLADDDALLKYVQDYGYSTLDEFKDYLKTNYKRTLAQRDYAKDQITDSEIDKYYNDNVYGDVTISHILVKIDTTNDSTDEEKKEAETKAQDKIKEIYEKLDGGTTFSEVAKEYSEDTATSNNGGRIGTFNKGEMTTRFNEEFENAVLKLEKGKYTTKAISSSYGYHIIYKDEQKEKPDLATIKQTVIDNLVDEKIKEDSKIEYKAMIELRKKYGVEFNDKELNSQYDNAVNNWLYSNDNN